MNDKRKFTLILAVLVLTIAISFAVYGVYKDRIDPETGRISNASYLLRQIAVQPSPQGDDPNETMAAVASQAPDFTMQDAAGNSVQLSSFQGKPVVLNFWTSWCSYCKTEMPYFESAYKQYGDQVQFVMLNPVKSERSSEDDGRNFIRNAGYTFPVFYETEGKVINQYGLRGFPATIFIDADGKITAKTIGAITQDKLNQSIESLLR